MLTNIFSAVTYLFYVRMQVSKELCVLSCFPLKKLQYKESTILQEPIKVIYDKNGFLNKII